MTELLIIYSIGIVVGMYSAWFEYFINKTKFTTTEFMEALRVSIIAWFIVVPWIIGDFIYQQIKKRFL